MSPKEGWFILTNFDKLEVAISAYKRRFDIEEMFRDFKKGGYNLEETNVTGELQGDLYGFGYRINEIKSQQM